MPSQNAKVERICMVHDKWTKDQRALFIVMKNITFFRISLRIIDIGQFLYQNRKVFKYTRKNYEYYQKINKFF